MPSANDFIRWAMKDLQVLGAVQDPDPDDATDVFEALNGLADALGIERLTLYKTVRTTKTLASGTASYTIGVGASINVERPHWIDRATIIRDVNATTPTETGIKILDPDEYAALAQKTQQAGAPSSLFYDRGYSASGYGLIYPFPIPNVAIAQLVLYMPGGHVSEFADRTTDYLFPRGYRRAIRKNLAVEIATLFEVTPSALLIQQAQESRAAIKRVNVRPSRLRCDPALSGARGTFDIETGGVR